MKKLGTRNTILLTEGARVTGSYEEAYYYAEERLYIDEAETLFEFCKWIDKEIGGAAERNIGILFEAFINPKNEEAVVFAQDLKEKIAEIRKLSGI
jgi:hypothetical protein